MDAIKRYPIFSAVLIVCLLTFATEAFFLWFYNSKARAAEKNFTSAVHDRDKTLVLDPAPTADNLAKAKDNVTNLRKQLDDVIGSLQSKGSSTVLGDPPSDGAVLQAQINSYVVGLRQDAKKQDVLLPASDFAFGMDQYIGPVSPPPPDKVALVYKQMKVLEYLLHNLIFTARDPDLEKQHMMISAVLREDVMVSGNSTQETPGRGGNAVPKGTFVIDPQVSARVPGAIETLAFQISFIAKSDALRKLLNELSKFTLPLVVRSIEVNVVSDQELLDADRIAHPPPPATDAAGTAPSGATGAAAATATTASAAAAAPPKALPSILDLTVPTPPGFELVVKDAMSKFTITIEFISIVAQKSADDAAAADKK